MKADPLTPTLKAGELTDHLHMSPEFTIPPTKNRTTLHSYMLYDHSPKTRTQIRHNGAEIGPKRGLVLVLPLGIEPRNLLEWTDSLASVS